MTTSQLRSYCVFVPAKWDTEKTSLTYSEYIVRMSIADVLLTMCNVVSYNIGYVSEGNTDSKEPSVLPPP